MAGAGEIAVRDMAAGPMARCAAEKTASLILAVENMNCGGCMRKVETTLQGLDGVSNARANLSAKRVNVSYLPAQIDAEAIIDALAGAGYKAGELAAIDDEALKAQEKDFARRLGVAGFAAMNVMLLSISVWSGGEDMTAPIRTLFHWLSALIALPAIVYAGQPFFKSAMSALRARRLNMDVPISLGVVMAAAMSLFQTMRGGHQVYFDAAITLLFFLLAGRFLDQRMRNRAQGAAQNLIGMMAGHATVIGENGRMERLATSELMAGMTVLVAAGERIPVDGTILSGRGDLDESLLSGESVPRAVDVGDRVYAGTTSLNAPLTIRAQAIDQDTLLAEIGRLMAAAEQGRGRYVRLADRAAAIYAPAVHGLALATFLGWLVFGAGWEFALTSAIAVLIITCPCALALAVPAVQVAASSRLFDRGIILKSPDALERLAEADRIIFDKTGTLTKAAPILTAIGEDMASPADRIDVLAQAAALAAHSAHPYARALVAVAHKSGLCVEPAQNVQEVAGRGLKQLAGTDMERRLGSAEWVGAGADRPLRDDVAEASLWYRDGDKPPVAFHFEDELREDAEDVISRLHEAGYKLELLSGDRRNAVKAAARDAGLSHWQAELNPQDKIARLERLKADGKMVVMVGDGLNDAPALAAAHASLSPSSATQISQSAADAIFQGELLAPIIETLAVARASKRMALQNFAIAAGYNALFVPLAMTGIVTPLIAAIAMSASSIAVTANAIRLRNKKLSLPAPLTARQTN